MKLSQSIVLATLSMALAIPANTGNALMDGAQNSVTNSRQVMDTLSAQLKRQDGHPTADVLSAFLTGADSQIDNAVGTLAEALSPLTFGLSEAVGGVLLGPFVQSVTNGAEVLITNLIGGGIDLVTQPAIKLFTQSLTRVSQMAAENKVDATGLNKAISQIQQLTPKAMSKRAQTGNALADGAQNSVTNSRQVMDTLSAQLKRQDGHPTADVLSAFLTGADSQIDNAVGTIAEALAPLTFGLSEAVGGVLLGPFVQSVTNGAEVLITNLIGGGIDLVTQPAIKLFTQSLTRVSQMAAENKVDATGLNKAISQITQLHSKAKRAQTGNALLDGAQNSATNSRQVMDTLTAQLKRQDGHPTADVLTAFLTGADSQIDNAVGTIAEALAPLTFGLSEAVGGVLLGPFVQSVTNGAEVLITNLIGGGIDLVTQPAIKLFTQSLTRVSQMAAENKVDVTGLNKAINQISSLTPKAKRAQTGNALMDGAQNSVTNSRQVMDTLSAQLKRQDGHPTADVLSAFLTGADSQIDNAVGTIAEALSPLTFGLSEAVGGVLLGPFVQSVTNGAEVLITNLIGGGVDLVTQPAIKLFTQSLTRVSQMAAENKVDATGLNKAISQIQQLTSKQ